MRRPLESLSRLLMSVVVVVLLASCHEHGGVTPDPVDPDPRAAGQAGHTLLLYMSGDSNGRGSLTSALLGNARDCAAGMLDTREPFNLVIYKDTEERTGSLPVLYQLKLNESGEKVDTVYLHRWEEDHNSVDYRIMADVINEVFTLFDTDVKGVCFGSHGLGWLPSSTYVPMLKPAGQDAAATDTRAVTYFGQDSTHFMEVWDMRAGLEMVPHLDYIIFDDCFMANAETVYELREQADYIVACPTEIMSAGLPYRLMIPVLADAQSADADASVTIRDALGGVVDAFESVYGADGTMAAYGGTISLLATSGIGQLRQAYFDLLEASADALQDWEQYPSLYERDIQHYGRSSLGTRYSFYDIQDLAQHLNPDDTAVAEAMAGVVLKEFHSETFSPGEDNIYMSGCHGLSVSVPAFLSLEVRALVYLNSYPRTQWAKGTKKG